VGGRAGIRARAVCARGRMAPRAIHGMAPRAVVDLRSPTTSRKCSSVDRIWSNPHRSNPHRPQTALVKPHLERAVPEDLLRLRRAERAPAPRGGRAPRACLVHHGPLELHLKGGVSD